MRGWIAMLALVGGLAPDVGAADSLQDYLECRRDALPESFGILSVPRARITEFELGEMNGGWSVELPRARVVYGFRVKRLRAYIGQHLNYTVFSVPQPIKRVRERLQHELGVTFEQGDMEGEPEQFHEPVQSESAWYYTPTWRLYSAPDRTTWVVCSSDLGNGAADPDHESAD